MSRLPLCTFREMSRILTRLGFRLVRRQGSHAIWEHPDGRVTVVPEHRGEALGRGLIRKILRDIDLTPEDYSQLR